MSPFRRLVPPLIAGAALIAAACSDAVAPTRSTIESGLPTVAAFGVPLAFSKKANGPVETSAQIVVFKIFPHAGTAKIGGFTLIYPDNAVCDPGNSGYGPNEWKKPCSTLKHPITIRGKMWVDENGVSVADFSPDIRFNPSANVYLGTIIPQIIGSDASDDVLRRTYSIGWSTRQGNTRYFFDDGAGDPDLITRFGRTTNGRANGWAQRRVEHFTGYWVREGIWCDDASLFNDPLCLLGP
jgi:hypothetical protein